MSILLVSFAIRHIMVSLQRGPHGTELFKSNIGLGSLLLDGNEFTAEREKVVELLLGGLGCETGDVDGVGRNFIGVVCLWT